MSERKVVKKKKKWGKIYEYTPIIRHSVLDDELAKEIEKEVKKSVGLTPSALASKFSIKVSLAKQILEHLEKKGDTTRAFSSGNYRVYSK